MTTEGSAEVPGDENPVWVAEIEAREQAATAGPWFVGFRGFEGYAASVMAHWPDGSDGGPIVGDVSQGVDCEFIAHAREDIPRLLAERTRLEARLAEVEDQRDGFACDLDHAEERLTALRAAVRPLVEAAGSARHYMRYGEGDPFQLVATIDAIMADPAIAALLEGGNDAVE